MGCVGVTLLPPTARTRRSTAAGRRWSEKGIFAQMMVGLVSEHEEEKTVIIDATYLKAHRTATSMAAKNGAGSWPNSSAPNLTLATCFPLFHRERSVRGARGRGCPRPIWSR